MGRRSPHTELFERLRIFEALNPDLLVSADLERLYELAGRTAPRHFPRLAHFARQLIDAYLGSPWKREEQQILGEYFQCIERASRLLAEAGEVNVDAASSPPDSQSVALVPRRLYSSLDWCKVMNAARIPIPVIRAVDAARRRNQLLYSVIEEILVILHRVDPVRSVEWETAYLESKRGDLDSDLVRDVLRAWRRTDDLPRSALEWAFKWSADRNVERQWPAVTREADLLLRKHALASWRARRPSGGSANLAHLKALLERRDRGDKPLRDWLDTSITDIGSSVHFFVDLSRSLLADPKTETAEWRRAALLREIHKVQSLFPPVLVLGDLILSIPNGAYSFALAFFGLTGDNRRSWERRVHEFSRGVLLKAFLADLRQGVGPLETIRRFCYGDRELFLRMMSHLDFATSEFDCLEEREKVVEELAVYYASYHEGELLAAEVARRYRDLMRVLHEDSLRRVLAPEQFAEVRRCEILTDLASIAADARRYLTRRRALETDLEHMVAAELDFATAVRQRRLVLIRKLLA